ncbi:MAG TPA: tetratricopeptide repeat protein [Gemmatimonadaceae bacterium]|nr:tetratricopeptide repeat protein [Gemmatimonadaceae bacterium]
MIRLAVLLALPLALAAQQPQSALTTEQLINLRRFEEAKAAIDAMLGRNKEDAHAMFLMGRLLYADGNSGQAVDWFEKAVKRDEPNATYHTWLGNALGDEAQKASKIRQPFLARRVKSEFERAVQLDSTLVDPREGLVGFYSMAPGFMGGSMEKAREQANAITKLNPIRGHLQLARVAERTKDSVTAEREYKAVVTTYPDSTVGYYSLGNFYRTQRRWTEAFATFELLMKAKPDELAVHLTWAGTAAQSGTNLERGEREAKYYLENAKDSPAANVSNAHWRLGQIYEQTGRKELARTEYTEALKLNPRNQNAKKSLDALK